MRPAFLWLIKDSVTKKKKGHFREEVTLMCFFLFQAEQEALYHLHPCWRNVCSKAWSFGSNHAEKARAPSSVK